MTGNYHGQPVRNQGIQSKTTRHHKQGKVAAAANDFQEHEDNEDVFEMKVNMGRLQQIADMGDRFRRFGDFPEQIFWLEKSRGFSGDRFARYVITPLNISTLMREAVYDPYPTAIFTTATLTVNGSFEYWKKKVGLAGQRAEELPEHLAESLAGRIIAGSFPSPFNYRERVLLGVPIDAPMPTEPGYARYVAEATRDVLELSEGKSLVLFTSYALLNEAYDAVQPGLSARGIHVFKQGDDDRHRLLTRFRDDTGSVLFATDSFWEGVDAPGESLQVLILSRLPFRVPTDPVLKARSEAIVQNGGNPFLELSLPEAAIKLKQGFGRLMRRSTDAGVILILDSRIVKKNYGSFLLDSLPQTARCLKERKYLLEEIENFIAAINR